MGSMCSHRHPLQLLTSFTAPLLALFLQAGLEVGSKGALAWDEAVVEALRAEYPDTFGKTFATPGILEGAVLRHVSRDSKKRKKDFDEIAEVKSCYCLLLL